MNAVFGFYLRDDCRPCDTSAGLMRRQFPCFPADRCDVWITRKITLGELHAAPRIAFTDGRPAPWVDTESGLVIVADARLDDRAHLICSLGTTPSSSGSPTDAMLILMAYRKWGNDCVNHLLGDYAFVIADPKKNLVFCARDPIGAKPFYYHLTPKLFVFASSAKAVAAHELVRAPIDKGRVADLLVGSLEWINETCSFFENVVRLPPAHWMEITPEKVTRYRYWNLDPAQELILASDEAYTDALQEVLEKAINDRLPGAGAVGSMLSGGVDSSSIVGILRHTLRKSCRQPLKTFSGISEVAHGESPCRETHFIDRVIADGDFDPTRLSPASVSQFQSELRAAEQQAEDPFDFGGTMHKLIYLNARRTGCPVVFDGVDGDVIASLTSSYPRYLLRAGKYKTALHELRMEYRNYFRRKLSPQLVVGEVLRAKLPIPRVVRKLRAQKRISNDTRQGITESFISVELAKNADLYARFAEYEENTGFGMKEALRHEQIGRIITADLTAGVERYYRQASGMGVENRQPLLDRRVIEFCVSLPWDQKCRDGWSKFALRNVAARFLPADVAWRQGWEEIAGKFHRALRTLTVKEDAGLILERGESLSEFIDWPRAREHAVRRLAGTAEVSGAESRLLALINWHDRVLENL